jgi:aspartyl-tRNA(Asn)/glutamyl-tRNA(Gln) amidotransferase subunit A
MTDPADLSLAEASQAVRHRETTSLSLTESILARIGSLQPDLNCFVRIDADVALASAERADREIDAGHYRGPLHGIPLAHKDMFDRTGCITGMGSRVANRAADQTATVLARLNAAGAVDLGVLNMDELAAGDTGINPTFGRCHNPWSRSHISGGSSAGAACAVAARLAFGALGGDTGGSIRQPAAACGVVGLKPTYGLVSRAGAAARAWSLDCIGPITRTVADCALMLQAIAGHDPQDTRTGQGDLPQCYADLSNSIAGTRIGIPVGDWFQDVSNEIAAGLDEAIRLLRGLKAIAIELEIPNLPLINDLHQIIVKSEAAKIHGKTLRHSPDALSERVRENLHEGLLIPESRYIEALSLRAELRQSHVAHVFANADVVIAPVAFDPVPTYAEVESRHTGFSESARLTRFANYLGIPSLAVPCGFTSNGLPMGFQLLAPCYAEPVLLRVGHAYLEEAGWHRAIPPASMNG